MQISDKKWGEYQEKTLWQEGEYSFLYQVENKGKLFALKLFKELCPLDLLQEARLLGQMESAYWPRLIEDHSQEKPSYFVAEWIEGEALDQLSFGNNFDFVLSLFHQIVLALATLHQKSWVHGDLKGSNILWTGSQIKILDLGFAKSFRQMGNLSISGTPAYLAPELFFGQAPSPSSDFYALAILFYRVLRGDFPFRQDRFQEVLRWHLFETAPNLHGVHDYIPVEFGDLLLRMLSKNPADRPASVTEILWLLQEKFGLACGIEKNSSPENQEAYEVLGEAIRFYENQKNLSEEEKNILGELYYRQGHLEKALALTENFSNLESNLLRIKIWTRLGNFDRAREASRTFERHYLRHLDDKQRLAYLNAQGVLDFYLGHSDQAFQAFQEAEEFSRNSEDFSQLAVTFNNLGNVLLEKGNLEEALRMFEKAVAYAQHSGDRIHEGMFWMSLGYFYHRQGQFREAYDYYQRSIEILEAVGQKNEKARSLLNLSNLLIEAGHLEEASSHLREAQEIFRQRKLQYLAAYSLLIEGDILSRQGKKKQACSTFEKAEHELNLIQRFSDVLWAQFHQAECWIALKNEQKAAVILEKINRSSDFERDVRLSAHVKEMEKEFLMEKNQVKNPFGFSVFEKELEKLEQELLGELDLSILVEKILDKMIQLTSAERGFVLLHEEAGPRIALARNMGQTAVEDSSEQISFSIARETMEKGEAVLTVDALEDSRFSVVTSIHHLKLRSILCLPFKKENQVLGAIYLDHRGQSGVFQPSFLPALKPFAEMLGKLLSNARQFFEVEQNLKATQKKLEVAEVELGLKYDYQNIVGRHPKMKEVFSMLDRVTDVEVPVVIMGESGVGKELIARAIHYHGSRSKRAFVSMNCQAIPESLFESELFGHVRGAFTGAISDRIGLVEQAHQGTLFLDEIGDMPLPLQGKLLRVLQEGKFRRLGDKEERPVNLRVLAATHRDLKKMIKEGSFREDLWFRISVVEIHVPALRERMEDLPLLVDYFLDRFAKLQKSPKKKMSAEAFSLLSSYPWPGNIRELENTMTNACVFARGENIEATDFRYKKELFSESPSNEKQSGRVDLKEFLKFPYREAVQFFEKKLIHQVLLESKGNISQASATLKIARPQLSRLVKKFKIKV